MENKPIQIALAGRLSGVGEYYFSKKLREIDQMRAAGQDIISLGVGGPDQPPHPEGDRTAGGRIRQARDARLPAVTKARQEFLREAFAGGGLQTAHYGVTLGSGDRSPAANRSRKRAVSCMFV
ncbi:MAG: hypothetical protein ACLR8Y_16665 [Alistipes indistinctus]